MPQRLIRSVRERIDYRGQVLMALDEDDVRRQLRELVDAGAQALVVCLVNAVENPEHELRVQEIFLEEYPAHQLGADPDAALASARRAQGRVRARDVDDH